jgi:GT2 family glycosyltransferase
VKLLVRERNKSQSSKSTKQRSRSPTRPHAIGDEGTGPDGAAMPDFEKSTVAGDLRSSGHSTRPKRVEQAESNGTLAAHIYKDPTTSEQIFGQPDASREELVSAEVFDAEGYLQLNPDVRDAIKLGWIGSAYSHYCMHGHAEGRPIPDIPREARNVMLPLSTISPPPAPSLQTRCSIDAVIIAPGSGLMIVGWINDISRPLLCIRIIAPTWRIVIDISRLVRVRRMDVEKALDSHVRHLFGFIGFLHFDRGGEVTGPLKVELWEQGGFSIPLECSAATVADVDLRNTCLAQLAGASFFGNTGIESIGSLGRGMGPELVRFNRSLTRRIVAAPYIERFGPQRKSFRGTIIVCLYGKAEFYFLQNCLFAGLPGIDEYEFVFVSNSPELAEALQREARSASLIYGLTTSVMILTGNAGFGGANNAAAPVARSNRLLIVNPDVFPRDHDWAKKHTALLEGGAPERTRLFGVPLYYDDGSLMHGGMYFETDLGLSMSSGSTVAVQVCRVEHYGKGAPPELPQFTRPRPVPAVTGAFISIDRSWFERLGGFTEDFIFGHYEDADLCLKSIKEGVAPWLHDVRMWHLEGKGSDRELAHEGGSLINRWLFSKTWIDTIEAGLKGPMPSHTLIKSSPLAISLEADAKPSKLRALRRPRVLV